MVQKQTHTTTTTLKQWPVFYAFLALLAPLDKVQSKSTFEAVCTLKSILKGQIEDKTEFNAHPHEGSNKLELRFNSIIQSDVTC